MPQLGPVELILILVIFVIFFGAGKLGDLGGALGRGLQEFKKNASLDSPPDEERRPDRSA
jgi:sec-independent protein translocase protein TatA